MILARHQVFQRMMEARPRGDHMLEGAALVGGRGEHAARHGVAFRAAGPAPDHAPGADERVGDGLADAHAQQGYAGFRKPFGHAADDLLGRSLLSCRADQPVDDGALR